MVSWKSWGFLNSYDALSSADTDGDRDDVYAWDGHTYNLVSAPAAGLRGGNENAIDHGPVLAVPDGHTRIYFKSTEQLTPDTPYENAVTTYYASVTPPTAPPTPTPTAQAIAPPKPTPTPTPRSSTSVPKQTLASVRKHGLALKLSCSPACTLKVEVKAGNTRLGLRTLKLSAKATTVHVKLNRSKLARHKRLAITLTLSRPGQKATKQTKAITLR